ncbi:SH3 domain-containing protein [Xanthobacter sp. KR7-65]|uniref:SH3 domain-containing protein n=1 Tax=Xanthobacter sp. KR7-65 TaxID=3156612 RepID=UPI0032B5B2C0
MARLGHAARRRNEFEGDPRDYAQAPRPDVVEFNPKRMDGAPTAGARPDARPSAPAAAQPSPAKYAAKYAPARQAPTSPATKSPASKSPNPQGSAYAATYVAARRMDAVRLDADRVETPRDHAQDHRPTLPSRSGAAERARRPSVRKASEGLLLWRVLGVSAAVMILGMGGVLAFHLVTPGGPGITVAAPTPAPAPRPRPIADAVHTQSAMKVASILGSAGDASARPVSPAAASTAAATPVAGPAAAPVDAGPTDADFARPAFLEPLAGDEPEEAAAAPTTVALADVEPLEDAVPLPTPRPSKMTPANDDDDDARSARIRSAVTLRSGPRRSASAIGTLAAGTKVKLYSCKTWCEVASADKRGYVYRASVSR